MFHMPRTEEANKLGMYTELVIACSINKEHNDYIDALNYMVNEIPHEIKFDDPLFKTERWRWMFRGDSDCFCGKSHSEFIYDDISEEWVITARFNIKNYTGEIGKFLEWIAAVANENTCEFVGYMRYEENEHPTLIYFNHGKVLYQ